MLIIPTRPEPEYEFRIALDGTPYRIVKRWNTRSEHWTLDILTDARERIISGLKLVIDYTLLRHHVDPRLPPGEFIALDPRGNRVIRPGRDSFTDGSVILAYLTAAEL